ncbi:hypothetical protein UT300012_32840 [Paraclostridium bifermentans]
MLIKGDKVKLVKSIGSFDKVGDIFEIIGVSELGTITIASSYGTGIMSYDEFEKYFEKIEEKPLVWSEWACVPGVQFMKYRTNGVVIEMIDETIGKKVKSVCLEGDTFDIDKGIGLCIAKLKVISANASIRESIKGYRVAVKELNKINRELGKHKR